MCIVLVLSSCSQTNAPKRRGFGANTRLNIESHNKRAEYLLSKSADMSGYEQTKTKLEAAEEFILAESPTEAKNVLSTINSAMLSKEYLISYKITEAQIEVGQNKPFDALKILKGIEYEEMTEQQKMLFLSTKSQASEQTGNYPELIRTRVRLSKYLSNVHDVQANDQLIWDGLLSITDEQLNELATWNPNNRELSAWIDLAKTYRNNQRDASAFQEGIQSWQQQNPHHSANTIVQEQLLSHYRSSNSYERGRNSNAVNIRKIALILNSDGTHKDSAKAIKDGFIAAYYQTPVTLRPELITLETNSKEGAIRAYQSAVNAGVDLVVGPLLKSEIDGLLSIKRPVPIIALNRPNSQGNFGNLYYFGLTPDLEAKAIIRHARKNHLKKALVITVNNDWGNRFYQYFQDYADANGIEIVQREKVSANQDIGAMVRKLLKIEDSVARAKKLEKELGVKLYYDKVRRKDADFIVIATPPNIARQIKPFLNYYYANDMEVIGTNTIYNNSSEAHLNIDLDGVKFYDMPWMITKQSKFNELKSKSEKLWKKSLQDSPRLFALGMDAYKIAQRFNYIQNMSYSALKGATGNISLDNNIIEIEYQGAVFQKGVPVEFNEMGRR